MGRLAGRTAIVTGGAKGIGRHYSLALAAEGARVMIADIADGEGVARDIAAAHGANSVISTVTDVSDEASVKALIAATMERFGKIDVLVNNAALYAPLQETKCTEIDVDVWDRVMAVNLRGSFLMVKDVAPPIIAPGHSVDAALRDLEGRHPRLHPRAGARAGRARHPGQHPGARVHPQRQHC